MSARKNVRWPNYLPEALPPTSIRTPARYRCRRTTGTHGFFDRAPFVPRGTSIRACTAGPHPPWPTVRVHGLLSPHAPLTLFSMSESVFFDLCAGMSCPSTTDRRTSGIIARARRDRLAPLPGRSAPKTGQCKSLLALSHAISSVGLDAQMTKRGPAHSINWVAAKICAGRRHRHDSHPFHCTCCPAYLRVVRPPQSRYSDVTHLYLSSDGTLNLVIQGLENEAIQGRRLPNYTYPPSRRCAPPQASSNGGALFRRAY